MSSAAILVVDDNPTNLKLVRVLLQSMGYQVATAVDAEDALEKLRGPLPRLVLMDLQLPGMDGLELVRRLKADPRTCRLTIVAVTAYAMRGDEERARAAGCDDYVTKPIDVDGLPKMVERWLREVPGEVEL